MSDYANIATIKDKTLCQLYTSIYILLKKDPAAAQPTLTSISLTNKKINEK